MFGSLTIFASGLVTNFPSSANASSTCCASDKNSGKVERIRAAKEMSFVSISMPELYTKDLTIGKNERVANAGASSVMV